MHQYHKPPSPFCKPHTKVVELTREEFQSGKTIDVEFRKKNLRQLLRFYQENEVELAEAVYADLKKPHDEAMMAEISLLLSDVRTMLANVENWSKQRTVGRSLATLLDWPYVRPQPRGVVLILAAWNYPLQLALLPLSGAIAAGCCAVVKPSELAPATAALLAGRLPRYLDARCFPVVLGGPAESRRLLQLRFDHIFFTGSTAVGRLVAAAASRYLTPITLELGGKSPVYLDDSVNMEYAARRIIWGKVVNLGQTCIAPDYLLCSKSTEAAFVAAARRALHHWLGDQPENSPSLGRMLNSQHFSRVRKLLESGGRVALGGRCWPDSLLIEPTVLTDVQPEDPVMQEEIFGPLLPIITVNSVDEAIRFINTRTPNALSLYVFSSRRGVKQRFVRETDSGMVLCNDTMYHAIVDQLPFGGVGTSGLGTYHGKHSFDTFSRYKPVLERNYNPLVEIFCSLRYPPYQPFKTKLAMLLLKNPAVPDMTVLKYIIVFMLGLLSIHVINTLAEALGYEDKLPGFLSQPA